MRADAKLVTGRSLPIHLLDDHLTAVLEDFEHRLALTGSDASASIEGAGVGDAAAHGLHRWQQGYDMAELARELGRLNESVVSAIEACAGEPGLNDPELGRQVRLVWAEAHGVVVSESAEHFAKLRQMEAASHIQDLETALGTLREVEAQRAALWREAAHDLRGNLSGVAIATTALSLRPEQRERMTAALGANVRSLAALLDDVTSLARLQGGQEALTVAPMNASRTMRELVESTHDLANDRGLTLSADGPEDLEVDGDAVKARRVVQNLLLNALRYTRQGSVEVSWGDDPASPATRWFAQVRDTGPGLSPGQGSRIAGAIGAASEQSRQVAQAEARGEVAHVDAQEVAEASTPAGQPPQQANGEGLGLSIVKRLCALLDATVELDTTEGKGSTFRVLFPKRYPD